MLSEDLKARAEANRQRALAIRAQKSSKTLNPQPHLNLATTNHSDKNRTAMENFAANQSAKSTGFASFSKSTDKAKCVLISMNSFEVVSKYNERLISICRDYGVYCYEKRRWQIPLKCYKAFMEKACAEVNMEGLPQLILTAFSSVINGADQKASADDIPNFDLRSIDQALLNCLFPFQIAAINFSISKGGRVLIADDMGLGKTVEALGVASYYKSEWPLLIITPAGIRYTWIEALRKFFSPSYLNSEQVFSPDSQRELAAHLSVDRDQCHVLIASYDMIRSQQLLFARRHYRVIIIDESHLIKDFKSERCKATLSITKAASRVILLSGTPALSRPIELLTQLRCVNPKLFKDYTEYAYRYCDAKKRPEQFGGGLDTSGSSNLEELEILLKRTVMIRRLKENVMSQLLPKHRHVVLLDKSLLQLEAKRLQSAKMHFFDDNIKNNEKRGALLIFFNETAKAKMSAVIDHVISLLNKGVKMVVFAHHQLMMDALHTAISSQGTRVIRIDGTTSSSNRTLLCNKFQTDDQIRVALLSITAAATGLTLTAANLVVFAELFWNPGILLQAEDRVHRVGQESDVEIQYLVAQGTSDDEIWNLVKTKLEVLSRSGLSKNEFKNIATVSVKSKMEANRSETSSQTCLDDFWNNLTAADISMQMEDDIKESDSKKLKLC